MVGDYPEEVFLVSVELDGRVVAGVELEDGSIFNAAKAVVSTIDPHQTFLDYVGEDNLESDFTDMIKSYQWEKWSLANLHLALSEPPNFKAAEANPEINQALIYILGYESFSELTAHYDAVFAGEVPGKAAFNCCFPSVHDPYQAPPGKATAMISESIEKGNLLMPKVHSITDQIRSFNEEILAGI